jgi:hypothetical protein
MTMTNSAEYLTALHESAHGVIAQMSGMAVKCIVLHRSGAREDEAGRCELFATSAERDADIPRYLRYCLAGAAAERRHVGKYSERDRDDVSHAYTLTCAMLNVEPDSPRAKTHFNSEQAIVDAWMWDENVWRWVTSVANALVKKRRLTGRDIHELRPAEARR